MKCNSYLMSITAIFDDYNNIFDDYKIYIIISVTNITTRNLHNMILNTRHKNLIGELVEIQVIL